MLNSINSKYFAVMSILDDIDTIMDRGDNVAIRWSALKDNSYREDSSIEEYSGRLSIYLQVMGIYVDFFTEYWCKDNVDKTNEMMTKELERVGIVGTNGNIGITRIWTGLTAEEHNALGEYVLALDFPPKNSEMSEFFKRVMIGDLEFLCRYPKNGTNAMELLKGVVY